MSRRKKAPAKPGPFRPGQAQPLHKTIARELGFSYAAHLAAAREVVLHVGYHPTAQPNELRVYLPANGLTVTLVFDSAETLAALPAPRFTLGGAK